MLTPADITRAVLAPIAPKPASHGVDVYPIAMGLLGRSETGSNTMDRTYQTNISFLPIVMLLTSKFSVHLIGGLASKFRKLEQVVQLGRSRKMIVMIAYVIIRTVQLEGEGAEPAENADNGTKRSKLQ